MGATMSSAEWVLVQGPSDAWFLAHFTELYLWPNAPRKQAPASSVTLASVTQVVNRIKTRKRLEN